MRYMKIDLTLHRLPDDRTLIEVRIGGRLWRSMIVPFNSVICKTRNIDRDLYKKFDYFEAPFLPDVIRLVNSVRQLMKNSSVHCESKSSVLCRDQ